MVHISLYSFAAVYNTVRGQPVDDLATDIIAFEKMRQLHPPRTGDQLVVTIGVAQLGNYRLNLPQPALQHNEESNTAQWGLEDCY